MYINIGANNGSEKFLTKIKHCDLCPEYMDCCFQCISSIFEYGCIPPPKT
jgi:hypothetical protein